MKQKLPILISFILLSFVFSSCIFLGPPIKGNGNVIEENRKVKDFEKIEASRGMNVYISQGDVTKVVVKADENLMEYIETRFEGDRLIVTAKANIREAKSKKVFITAPHLESIKASSGSNVFSETMLNFKNLDISGSAGSNITLEINSEFVEFSASAGSNIKLNGSTNSFHGKTSAGSNVKAEDLTTAICDVKASSGSNIWINVQKELNASVSSGANLFYNGEPNPLRVTKSSGGNVIKK